MGIKEKLKNNQKIEYLYQCIKYCKNTSSREKIIRLCEEKDYELVELELQEGIPQGDIGYYIDPVKSYTSGFCSNLSRVLLLYKYADDLGLQPILYRGKDSHYIEKKPFRGTEVFLEYYFEKINNCDNTIKWKVTAREAHENLYLSQSRDKIEQIYIDMMKKYCVFNELTTIEMKSAVEHCINLDRKTLGVKFRGTDYYKSFKDHPIMVSIDELIEKVNELITKNKYEEIYLATEDIEALEKFKKEYKDKLRYNETISRYGEEQDHIDNAVRNSVDNAAYQEGLDLLKDLWVLANCNGFIGTNCGVSQFAIVFNKAYCKSWLEDAIIIDKGIRKHGKKSFSDKRNNTNMKQKAL